jgi:hypothetical protein
MYGAQRSEPRYWVARYAPDFVTGSRGGKLVKGSAAKPKAVLVV